MDPFSQGVLGAVASQSATRRHVALAGALGFISALTPDLDILIRSDVDPIVFLEYHRQFTHALAFIPFGGLLCALVLYPLAVRGRLTFARTFAYCTAGYATHGLLDACTSYGTQLLWPFSAVRIAWNTISIIDPLLTLPLLACAVVAARTGDARWGRMALVWVAIYLGLGVVQRERVERAAHELARTRNHSPLRLEAKPSFGNVLVWKSIYEFDGRYYVDAVRATAGVTIYPGESVPALDVARDFPGLDPASQQARDIERFRWFSDDFLSVRPDRPDLIVDMRYSLVPNRTAGLWGIAIAPYADARAHAAFQSTRSGSRTALPQLWAMVRGEADVELPCARATDTACGGAASADDGQRTVADDLE